MRQRHRIFLQYRRLVLVESHDDVAVAHGDELVHVVQHREQVVSHLVVERIEVERLFDRGASPALVPDSEQVHAEIGECARVSAVERDGAARQFDSLVESVIVRGHLARDAVHVAVIGRDGQRLGDLGVELLRLVIDVGDRPE